MRIVLNLCHFYLLHKYIKRNKIIWVWRHFKQFKHSSILCNNKSLLIYTTTARKLRQFHLSHCFSAVINPTSNQTWTCLPLKWRLNTEFTMNIKYRTLLLYSGRPALEMNNKRGNGRARRIASRSVAFFGGALRKIIPGI